LDFKTPACITDAGYRTRSTRRALEKFVQRIYSSDDAPSRDRQGDDEKQSFNRKFPTLFARKITSG